MPTISIDGREIIVLSDTDVLAIEHGHGGLDDWLSATVAQTVKTKRSIMDKIAKAVFDEDPNVKQTPADECGRLRLLAEQDGYKNHRQKREESQAGLDRYEEFAARRKMSGEQVEPSFSGGEKGPAAEGAFRR